MNQVRPLLLLFAFMVSIAANGQNRQRITVSFANDSLISAIGKIEKTTDYRFIYTVADLTGYKANGTFRDENVETVLKAILSNKPLTFSAKGKIISIKKVKTTRHLQGVVYDDSGEVIPGAVIKIKDTQMGAVTDANGYYDFVVHATPCTLVFSYVGFTDHEEKYAGSDDVVRNIKMTSNTNIDEVVITGYNIINRRQLTSSVTTLKAEDIMRPGVSCIDQMLEGQVPDMIFMNNSGEVGSVPKLRIRGTSTLIGNREPLWVLDGVVLQNPVDISPEELNNPDYVNRIGNAIAGINPQDIERIDVLKDASATALYGAKAANGVIVINTKKGHIGKPIVNYNMTMTVRTRPSYTDHSIDLMNSKERVDFSRYLVANGYNFGNNSDLAGYEALASKFYSGEITQTEFARQVQRLEGINTDWFDILTRNSFSTSHTASVSGGSDNARYYGSLGYNVDNGVVKGNKSERYSYVMKLDMGLSKIFSISLDLSGNISRKIYAQNEISPLDYAYNTSRAIPAYDETGNYSYYQIVNGRNSYNKYNILNELGNSHDRQDGNTNNLIFTINARPFDYLKASLIASIQSSSTDQDLWWGEKTYHAAALRLSDYGGAAPKGDDSQSLLPFGGELTQNFHRNKNYMVRFQVDFNKYLDENQIHNITASAGVEASSTRYKSTAYTQRGYYENRGKQFTDIELEDYPYYKNWLKSNHPTITDNKTNMLSAYFTVSYTYNNLFTLNANARMDGSNKFGSRSNEKLLPIWSVSGNYNLSEHKLLKRDWIDFIMLKMSYGYQGNMLDGQTSDIIITQLPTDPVYNELVSEMSSYPNPNLKWEKTHSYNAGISFSLFKRRLQFESEFYYKKTYDAFLNKNISTVNGISQYVVNSGDVVNKGFNFSITAVPIRFKDFSWTVSTSFSKVYNELRTSPSSNEYTLNDYLNGTALVAGSPVGTFYSYKFIGLSPKDGAPIFDDGEEIQNELTGLSNEALYTSILTRSGRREPTMSGTFNNTVRYRQWRLNAILNYSLGNDIRLFKLFQSSIFNPSQNINKEFTNCWMAPGDELHTNIPNPLTYTNHWSLRNSELPTIASNNFDEYNYSDIRVVSGDYLKVSTLSLTYEFDKKILARLKLSRLALNITGNNLYTFCSGRLKGQTPQQSGFSTIELSDRPSYTLGLDISF